jgi:glycerol-3-phosphate dehydrogenase
VRRDPGLLQASFDVLVVGAGIYGAAIAWDAAQRGLSVALVDRNDFGGGTSFNNAKTVHGGVRSLQRGAIAELRQYVRERRALSRIAPHLVHPLPFLLPTRGWLQRSRAAMAVYFKLYDLLSSDRNDGLLPSRHLPPTHMVGRDGCLAAHRALGSDASVSGGILWHDAQLFSGERLTLAFVKSAARAGAVAANYVELTGFLFHGGRTIVGATVRDRLAGRELEVRARLVMNATGPSADTIARMAPLERRVPLFDALSLAMNVVVPSFESQVAIGGAARGRLFFLAPWRHVTVGGSSHDPIDDPSAPLHVTRQRVQTLLDDLNAAFPGAGLRIEDVRLVHRGLLPSHAPRGSEVRLVKQSVVRDHREDGCDGLLSVVGTRFTTARDTAEHAVTRAFRLLGHASPSCRTATTPLVGAEGDEIADAGSSRLARLYGSEREALDRVSKEQPDLQRPLADGCEAMGAEIAYAVREEMAVRLADAVLRRSDVGSAGHPGVHALRRAGEIMAVERGWTAEDLQAQIAEVETVYAVPDC